MFRPYFSPDLGLVRKFEDRRLIAGYQMLPVLFSWYSCATAPSSRFVRARIHNLYALFDPLIEAHAPSRAFQEPAVALFALDARHYPRSHIG